MAPYYQLPSRQNHRIQTWKIAVDLGSNFSSASYCLTSESTDDCMAGEVWTVQNYKCASRNRLDTLRNREVPTKVRYEAGGNIRWGWDAARLVERGVDRDIPGLMVDLFKPGLDDKNETREDRRYIEELLVRLQCEFSLKKTVDDVVTDFLERLLRHVKDQMEPHGYREDDSVHLICTVPAMWSIKAKRRTIKAAKKAAELCRITLTNKITLLSEVEAATSYLERKNSRTQFKRGNTFIVCDAGGVTVDVVTYTVHSVEPLLFNQVTRSKGDSCGSSFLNDGFESQIRGRVQEAELRTQKQLQHAQLDADIKIALSHFEIELKRDHDNEMDEIDAHLFSTGKGGELPLQWIIMRGLEPDSEHGLREDGMAITKCNLEMIFDPILKRCWDLIQDQLQIAYGRSHEPTHILLVGGFGYSPRLGRHLKEMCTAYIRGVEQSRNRKPIKVLVPDMPGSAIAEGAIYRALQEGMVKDYISRSSICICSHDPYNPRQPAHEGAAIIDDPFEGRKYVRNCVKILLRTDQVIPLSGIKKSTPLHRTVSAQEKIISLVLDIYEMEDANGLDNYPLSHPGNQGYKLLERVEFKVEVEPIRKELEPTRLGSSPHVEHHFSTQNRAISDTAATSTLRRSTRLRKASPEQSASGGSQSTDRDPKREAIEGTCYYSIDYHVEVEFKDELMSYRLFVDGVGSRSFEGTITLGPSIEAHKQ